MTDDELLKNLQTREPGALEEMMQKYNRLLYTIIYNILKNSGCHGDMEELVSDTFYAVWTHADNIRPGNLKAYLSITARNKAKTFLRSRQPFAMDIDELELPDSYLTPEGMLLQEELSHSIQRAIHRMRPGDREIFLRYYYYLQNTEEIVEHMNMPASTVRSHLARGRKVLKKMLSKEVAF